MLGNAHTTMFFALAPQPEAVVAQALQCYAESEANGGGRNPDLFFSRAQVIASLGSDGRVVVGCCWCLWC